MDLRKIPLFDMMARRLAWLGQRQQVLATNIANADTPDYKPRDVKPLDFAQMARGAMAPLQPVSTHAAHLPGRPQAPGSTPLQKDRDPIETTISGNAVTIEEQLMKANQNATDYELTTNLYRKHLAMFREAVRSNN